MNFQESPQIIEHDIRGQICPSCLLYTLKEINEQQADLKAGRIELLILTDNRHATTTIPDAVASMGYRYFVTKKEGYYEIRVMQNNQR